MKQHKTRLVLFEVGARRVAQDKSGSIANANSPPDWLGRIHDVILSAFLSAARSTSRSHEFRAHMIEVAALAIAAIEWLDQRQADDAS